VKIWLWQFVTATRSLPYPATLTRSCSTLSRKTGH